VNTIVVSILKILEFLLKNHVFTMRTGLGKGLKRRYGFGFKPKFSLTEEEKFLMISDFKGKIVFDVGGYVGIHAMFFARAVGKMGKVITFEPNPKNYEELLYNVSLNGFDNVTTLKIGLGRSNELADLVVDPLYPTRGTVEESRKERMLGKRGVRKIKVEIASLDSLVRKMNLPQPDFVKVDAEGLEMDVLYGMVETIDNFKPDLFIEMHGEIPGSMIELLTSKGYSIYHIESDTTIDFSNYPVIKEGHLLCN
jgi:FkbM family methyltransferase